MSEWITHRLPTAADAGVTGCVMTPVEHDGAPDPGKRIRFVPYTKIALGDRWWPENLKASRAAAAEREAAAADVPSDKELWQLQREARGLSTDPDSGAGGWVPGDRLSIGNILAHRALYDRGAADGYRHGLEKAKAISEFNSELARDLAALQEENAKAKKRVEWLKSEIKVLDSTLNSMAKNADSYKQSQREMSARIAQLEPENDQLKGVVKILEGQIKVLDRRADMNREYFYSYGREAEALQQENDKLRSEVKDLSHRLGLPETVAVGDLVDANDAEPTIPNPIQ